jgi:hypothetical protein
MTITSGGAENVMIGGREMPTLTLTPAIDETGKIHIVPNSNVPKKYLTTVMPPLLLCTCTISFYHTITVQFSSHLLDGTLRFLKFADTLVLLSRFYGISRSAFRGTRCYCRQLPWGISVLTR